MATLPPELEAPVENLSPFQRTYCEYRAKGLKQAEAAHRAGSNAKDRTARGRIGYAVEQIPGVRDYIFWLQQQRAKIAMIDQVEIIDKLRQVFTGAMREDKFGEANKSVELMGKLIGLFSNGSTTLIKGDAARNEQASQADAFRAEEGSEEDPNDTLVRMEKLQLMILDGNKK